MIANAVDGSGFVEVSIWRDYIDGNHNNLEVAIDPDFVLIGGGARVTNFNNTLVDVDALLVSEYPKNDGTFSTFVAESKDHRIPYSHRLWVYAIGMKLYDATHTSIASSTVRNNLNLSTSVSTTTSVPSTSSSIPNGYSLLSGGTKVSYGTGQGSLLFQSGAATNFPSNSSWYSSSKDHYYPSQANVEAYTLSINPNIAGFGTLEIAGRFASKLVANHKETLNNSVYSGGGWLLAGIGAYSQYNTGSYGRLLFEMYPVNSTSSEVGSKDHISSDVSGTLYSFITMIRKL